MYLSHSAHRHGHWFWTRGDRDPHLHRQSGFHLHSERLESRLVLDSALAEPDDSNLAAPDAVGDASGEEALDVQEVASPYGQFESNVVGQASGATTLTSAGAELAEVKEDPAPDPVNSAYELPLVDFDGRLRDEAWKLSQPADSWDAYVAPYVGRASHGELLVADPLGGPNGEASVSVSTNEASTGAPRILFLRMKTTELGGLVKYDTPEMWMLPPGQTATHLGFWAKFDAPPQPPPYGGHLQLSGHFRRMGGAGGTPGQESDNWKFYDEVWMEDPTEWTWVSISALPDSQRNTPGPTPADPTQPYGDYWSLLTRFYIQSHNAFRGTLSVAGVQFYTPPRLNPIDVTFKDHRQAEVVPQLISERKEYAVVLENPTSTDVEGYVMPRGSYALAPILEGKQSLPNESYRTTLVTVPAGSTREVTLSLDPKDNLVAGQKQNAGVAFLLKEDLPAEPTTYRYLPHHGPQDAHVTGAHIRILADDGTLEESPDETPDVLLQGRADVNSVDAAGDVIQFTYDVTNIGNVVLEDLAIDADNTDSAPIPVGGTSSTWRYPLDGSFVEGPVHVDFSAGSWQDNAAPANFNRARRDTFSLAPLPPELIVDNADPTGVSYSGAWSTGAAGNFFGANFHHDGNGGKGTKSATFTPTIAAAGTYEVYMWWKNLSVYSDSVPVEIDHQGGSAHLSLNQRVGGGEWNLLGTYRFDVGTAGSVTIRNEGTAGYVVADAVRFVPVAIGDDTTPPAARLADPLDTAEADLAKLNARAYLDVQFLDEGGGGLDHATIVDAAREFALSGAGAGSAAVVGAPSLVEGTESTYRYDFSGKLAEGEVIVEFTADGWRDASDLANANLAQTAHFSVTSAPTDEDSGNDSLPPTAELADPTAGMTFGVDAINERGYIDVTFADLGGAGLNHAEIADSTAEFTLSGDGAGDVTVGGVPTFVRREGVFDVSEVWTYRASHTVTQEEIDRGTAIVNVATVSSDATGSRSATEAVAIEQRPALAIEASADVAMVEAAGATITYSFLVSNTGNVSLTAATLESEHTDADPVLMSGDSDQDGVLDVGETWVCVAVRTVTQADLDRGGEIASTVTVNVEQLDPQTGSNSLSVMRYPGVAVEVVADVPSVDAAGESIGYTYRVTNTGNVSLANLTLGADATDAPPVLLGGDADLDGKLDVDEAWTYGAAHTVVQAEMDGGASIVSRATVTSSETAPQTASASVAVARRPELELQGLSNVGSVDAAGEVVTFSYQVANAGNVTLRSVTLATDNSDGPPTRTGGDVDFDDELDVGETWSYRAALTASQAEIDAGEDLIVVATAESGETGPVPHLGSVAVVRAPAITLAGVADVASVAAAGEVISYSYSATNAGNVSLTGVTLDADNIDGGPELVSGTTSTYRYAFSGSFAQGPVQVDFTAGSWQDTAAVPNLNGAETASFTVTDAPPPSEIIVDNDDPTGVSFVGAWSTGAAGNFYGDSFRHDGRSGKGAKSASFAPELTTAGTYDVYMWWKSHAAYYHKVPIEIAHAAGTTMTTVNQRVDGGQWNLLGTFDFDAGTTGSVTISNAGTTGYVVADAVRFAPRSGGGTAAAPPSTPVAPLQAPQNEISTESGISGATPAVPSASPAIGAEVIVDNSAAAGVTFAGNWSTGAAGNFYGDNFRHDARSGKGTKSAIFSPTLEVGGTYDVYMWWKNLAVYAGNVPVEIAHRDGTTSLSVDQRSNGGMWNLLGTFQFDAGTSGSVTISNVGTTGYVVADAVRFVPVAVEEDTTAPVANLVAPASGEVVDLAALNGRGYIDVEFADLGGSGLDRGSIIDVAGEFALSGAGAAQVAVDEGATLIGGDVDGDHVLDVGETWVFRATHRVTEEEIAGGAEIVNRVTIDSDEAVSQLDEQRIAVIGAGGSEGKPEPGQAVTLDAIVVEAADGPLDSPSLDETVASYDFGVASAEPRLAAVTANLRTAGGSVDPDPAAVAAPTDARQAGGEMERLVTSPPLAGKLSERPREIDLVISRWDVDDDRPPAPIEPARRDGPLTGVVPRLSELREAETIEAVFADWLAPPKTDRSGSALPESSFVAALET